MDSIMMIDLADHLGHAMNKDLSVLVSAGYPTIHQLARHLSTLTPATDRI